MFKKYPSIENHYREKFIEEVKNFHPNLNDYIYVATEKLHGANIQIYFEKNKTYQYGKRTSFLSKDEKFFDMHNTVHKYSKLFDDIQKYVNETDHVQTLRLFGEYIAPGINKGIDYGKDHRFFFFDVYINGELQSQNDFQYLCADLDIPSVPYLGLFKSLDDAMNYDIVQNTHIFETDKENIMEGIVIKPYYGIIRTPRGDLFYLKKKNEKFLEKSKAPKRIKTQKEVTDEDIVTSKLNKEFILYITDNRLQNIFSKYGEISYPKQIGSYIKYLVDDAKDDFGKDHDLSSFDKGQLKKIFNAGSLPFSLIKKHL